MLIKAPTQPDAPQREARIRMRLRARVYNANRGTVTNIVRGIYSAVADAAQATGDRLRFMEAASQYLDLNDPWPNLFETIYRRAAPPLAVQVGVNFDVLDPAKAFGPSQIKQTDAEAFRAEVLSIAVEHARSEVGSKIYAPVRGFTRRQILAATRSVVDQALRDGVNARTAARRLRRQLTSLSRWRSETIARTELLRAANYGSNLGARQVGERFGLELSRQWLTAIDGRERASHGAANRQTVGPGEPFIVGGHECQYPHDPDLPVEEVANCRCAEAYIPA